MAERSSFATRFETSFEKGVSTTIGMLGYLDFISVAA